jgi:predicted nucleic acid-binding Zn ribbon protein
MSDAPLRKCPECAKSQLRRLVSASRFRLKGSGWYETDFKNKNETKRNLLGADAAESTSDSSSDSGAKEEAKKEVAAVKSEATDKPKAKPVAGKAAAKKTASKPKTGKVAKR